MSSWCLIESDPGVFTELIEKMGVQGAQVEELVTLDESGMQDLKPVYGLIFLFKYDKDKLSTRPTVAQPVPGLFFAKQVITNACATQAILSVLLNQPDKLELGPALASFREFTQEFTPQDRGDTLSSLDHVRIAHNSFARPEPFVVDQQASADDDEDVFHFVAYTPFQGTVYELDGLQPGPVEVGKLASEGQDWLEVVRPHILERIQKYSSTEVHFNLMAIVGNRRDAAEEELITLDVREAAVNSKLAGEDDAMDIDELGGVPLPDDPAALAAELSTIDARKHVLAEIIEEEQAKRKRWQAENTRRRHNYVPFTLALVKLLARKQKLTGLVDTAYDKFKLRMTEKAAQKARDEAAKKETEASAAS